MPLVFLYLFVGGLCIGSFVYTSAMRIHKNESLWPASRCDACNEKVGFVGLIPIAGFLFRGGRCSYCRAKISPIYPVFELFNGILVLWIFSRTGFTWEFLRGLLIFESILLLSVLDFRSHLIYPQPIVLVFLTQALWLAFFPSTDGRGPFSGPDLRDGLAGLFIGAGVFHFVSYFYRLVRDRMGLGEGDATMLGIVGFFLGWEAIIPVVMLSALLGIVGGGALQLARGKSLKTEIAFGPWISFAAFLVWAYPDVARSLLLNLASL